MIFSKCITQSKGIDEEFIYDSDFLNNDDMNYLFNEADDE